MKTTKKSTGRIELMVKRPNCLWVVEWFDKGKKWDPPLELTCRKIKLSKARKTIGSTTIPMIGSGLESTLQFNAAKM